jgi:ISXO2-like transposase domain
MRRLELYAHIHSDKDAINWCREKGLLLSEVSCSQCSLSMNESRHDCQDGTIWKCKRTINGNRHYTSLSIRHGSFFSGSHLSIKKIIYLLYEWSMKTPSEQAIYQLDIAENTVNEFYQRFREIAATAICALQRSQIGGDQDIVEIDECQLGRRKHHRGRVPKEIWAFGAIVRHSKPPSFFIETVKKRDKSTLTSIIERRIHQGSRIISDGWGAYSNLVQLGFNHSLVNHSINFVDTSDSTIHTQNIENVWRCLRRFLHSKGSYYRRHLEEYIQEFMFRKVFVDPFEQMISCIEQLRNHH